jgi:hypothetical protein
LLPPPLALMISARRWSMSVPVMISPLTIAVARRWLVHLAEEFGIGRQVEIAVKIGRGRRRLYRDILRNGDRGRKRASE